MRKKDETLYIKIIDYVNNYFDNYNRSPSTREISQNLKVSRATVQRYLQTLKSQGYIEYDGHRNIITEYIQERHSAEFSQVPLSGNIPCGDFNPISDFVGEHHLLPRSLTGPGEFFLLEAYGDSMIDVGINNKDLVLIKKQQTAESGQIVAALYNSDQTTLKRYIIDSDCIILHPENHTMEDIIIDKSMCENLEIQGVATMILKKI